MDIMINHGIAAQCGNRILKAFANSVDPDETPQNVAVLKKDIANSVDPDETPHDGASHLGLRCLLKGIVLQLDISVTPMLSLWRCMRRSADKVPGTFIQTSRQISGQHKNKGNYAKDAAMET
ncbi:hypothetical protein DPMN_027198 [Dreissena polymorpha]|uniref:Uncharacterized protein n=1 Tax=Dreissena polymorpha TaxID=45954 RepID=A0A9D4RF09_DREPO|nr:hypothetical protein DPMN_027198 [Dreissena polymorpha]